MGLALIADYRRRFTQVFAQRTNEEKRTVARCFLKKIEVDPHTGNVLMYLFSRPLAATIPQKSIETPHCRHRLHRLPSIPSGLLLSTIVQLRGCGRCSGTAAPCPPCGCSSRPS